MLAGAQAAFADSDEPAFPVWTYWVEIVEHAVIFLVSATTAAYLVYRRKKASTKIAAAGFGILAIGELLTILHHFLAYPFGVWNAIVNHALLLAAVSTIAYALARSLKEK